MMQGVCWIVEAEHQHQSNLKPLLESRPDGQDLDILKDFDEDGQYCLPRSSPVISRAQDRKRSCVGHSSAKNCEKPSMVSNNTEELPGENFTVIEGPSPLLLQNIFGRLSTSNTPNQLHNVSPKDEGICLSPAQTVSQGSPPDTGCALEVDMKKVINTCSREQESPTCGSSPSQCTIPEETDLLKIESSQLEIKITPCLGTQVILGPDWEEQITEELYRNSVDLDQENAHFVVVDMVLEVLETAKWSMSQKYTDSSSFDSGYEEYNYHGFSSNMSSLALDNRYSAESLAQKLMEIGRWWIHSEELLGEFPLATISTVTGFEPSLTDKIRQRSRMRGTFIWSPPQFQIITSLQLTKRRSSIVASQNFLCAGCGTEVETRYLRRLRYCEYLGKYFCDGCHSGDESMIPARVLNLWDFGRYPVSQFSKKLLDSIWKKPLFKITSVNKNLYSHAKELQKFKELQEQIISIKKLLTACRLSDGVLSEFQQLPSHVSQELHLFSMDDLVKAKRGQLIATARAVMSSATAHVEACELCQAKGFICEFCRGPDVLFPFQTDICTRCQECRTCFHTSCFRDEPCPKCIRIQNRKSLQQRKSFYSH